MRALEVIERNARAQARLIDDLLDIGRIVGGNLRLDRQPADLASIVERSIDTLQPAASAKGIHVKASLEGAPKVLGDGNRLQQIVSNLLSNAVKFTPEEGRVDVCLGVAGGKARITVRDTGRGIPPELLPQIFEPFRQGEGRPSERQEGLGLGLAITRYLVEQHGGAIRVESLGAGVGAVFTVDLPLLES